MEKHHLDTTSKLWDYYYKVRIPYLQSRSMTDVHRYGTDISGIREIDEDISGRMLTTMLTVSKMVDYYREGVSIRVVDVKDVKEIYEAISQHIHTWKSRLEHGINLGDAPIDDLIALDQFAAAIYENGKYQFTPETVNSIFATELSNLQRVNAHNFFTSAVNNALPDNVTVDGSGVTRINGEDMPERDSLGEFFKSRLTGLRRY